MKSPRNYCDVNWGSHSCSLPRDHEGKCVCCCICKDHVNDPRDGCVGAWPYYGPQTRFFGGDVVSRGLPEFETTDDEDEDEE